MTTEPPSRGSHVCQHPHTAVQATEARLILIAGADAGSMEEVATPIFRAGHVPLIGHWFTDPLVALSGCDPFSEDTVDQVRDPLIERLLTRCDAILRVGGASAAADEMVGLGRSRGLRVFFSLQDALDG